MPRNHSRDHSPAHGLIPMFLGLLLASALGAAGDRQQRLQVDRGEELRIHEWGTFTSLQDEHGVSIGGLNVDDEPVPTFVHRLAPDLIFDGRAAPALRRKGLPRAHPHVTMRLETPVVYFHLPRGWSEPVSIDVEVAFHGGWLTEYYPDAEAVAPGVSIGTGGAETVFGPLHEETVSFLTWRGLRVGVAAAGPETDAHVWLAPRAVDAADVRTPAGESERFLFYRGVAHREAPIRVFRDEMLDVLRLAPHPPTVRKIGPLAFADQWLVDIREDGSTAFRTLPAWIALQPSSGIETPASFADIEYSATNLEILRAAMHDALVAAGLYIDEANAMLETWELSYFKSPGLRLFFLVPRAWTDRVLPLEISTSSPDSTPPLLDSADVERVMMGRIELVTPQQRELLRLLAAGPARNPAAETETGSPSLVDRDLFQALGRFRHALLLREQLIRPTPALDRFVAAFGIRGYRSPEQPLNTTMETKTRPMPILFTGASPADHAASRIARSCW